MKKFEILQTLITEKLVAVIRGNSPEEAVALTKGAIEGGITSIELTYTTPFVHEVFTALKDSGALIGAGTVLDAETARHAILHGAQFVVSPSFNESIAQVCNRYSIPYLPGCMTIREMVKALEAGCDVLKLFPANNFTPGFIKSVKGPLPNVNIMPTGGINASNMKEWLEAGAVAVGIGSDLNRAYKEGGYEAVVATSKNYRAQLSK
ncbi:bifunctional 4-hydroxy-2-oxoglutarate aldolase/2-dehydro-3-deoxy-phosphogluconate aldolase [Lysinibacillus yapensis]|uniref:Bifunctional 4-hydroxy-2-oxoglutarate aldolase/2-dehydro-3-deoxy-phosphogluconate aldolase n=1 Tax=Ureibacillus yapensis TaxID=2304605 RepID=A0A396S6W5_9BACL|nr:bifunctional 2-keto-4-hydroxyglutarate aldolase/2-keto-3-deoxy-6-phosphogluconate aldolase [Lysinibacillus yapensis]RHW36214.1 bifunctional 4-hydroxy-2-oxoglutarate aldolase/2-dehydro-3-deoxy-phosphogluconate aldolase [Lysinibacillus yapensis]